MVKISMLKSAYIDTLIFYYPLEKGAFCMARPVRRLTRKEVNNQYTNSLFEEFILERRTIGREEKTLDGYTRSFHKFMNYFGDRAEETGDIVGSMFIEWTAAMQDEGLRTASINSNLANVRAFFYWCMDDERKYIERFKIRLVREQETRPKDYCLEDVEKLIKRPDRKEKNFTIWRSWAMSCFVIGTGARVGTMAEIQMKDVKLKAATVEYSHTKNKQAQTANLSPQLVKCLSDYIEMWRYDAEPQDYLFCNADGEKATTGALRQGYMRYTKSRGVNQTNIHGLRHTFAREWILNDGNIVQLSRILGHKSIIMSDHYANIYASMNKDKFIEHNPLEHIARRVKTGKRLKRQE